MRVAPKIILTEKQREVLESCSRGRLSPVRLAQRARIVLLSAEGLENQEIAEELSVEPRTVSRWRLRFARLGLVGIEKDLPRAGCGSTKRKDLESLIVEKTTQEKPLHATHWSTRSLARELGTTQTMVHRVWQANGLKPHLVRNFKLSNDARFEEKLKDVVGLYLNPPENALVFSADEKSQCQALDRTQPSLPMIKGRCGTLTHDYKRNGTTTLFAALSMLDGKVIGDCMPRHRHQEFIRFLRKIDSETPAGLKLHLIVDNYGTHKHPRVKSWIRRHPRFHLHFIPTSSSWVNMVERWFREITDKRIRRGVFRSVPELIAAIEDYMNNHNQNPRVFVWTASVESIMAKIAKCKEALDALH
jgi:transposase/DNA-binding CsgD family transcriptional regulator